MVDREQKGPKKGEVEDTASCSPSTRSCMATRDGLLCLLEMHRNHRIRKRGRGSGTCIGEVFGRREASPCSCGAIR